MTSAASDDLLELTAKYSHRWPAMIDATLNLRSDLGINGESATRFMQAFETRFDVDMSGYIHRKFFDSWDMSVVVPDVAALLRILIPSLGHAWRVAPARTDMTVAHLAAVIESKRWRDPALSAPPRTRSDPTLFAFAALQALAVGGIAIFAVVSAINALVALTNGIPSAAFRSGLQVIVPTLLLWGVCLNTRRRLTERFGDWNWGALTGGPRAAE